MRLSRGKNIDKNNDTVGRQFAARISLLQIFYGSQMEQNMGNGWAVNTLSPHKLDNYITKEGSALSL